MDLNSVEERVEAGKRAWLLYSLALKASRNDCEENNLHDLDALMQETSGEMHPHFWYTLHKIIENRHIPKPVVEDKKMEYEEAIKFECELMPFGKFKGVPIGSLKMEYLLALTEPNTFMKKLKKYVEWRTKQDE